jgi:histidinol dehydrogenase
MKRLSGSELLELRNKNFEVNSEIKNTVEQIVNEVKQFGDKSLKNYSKWLENNISGDILIDEEELAKIAKSISKESKDAIDIAWNNIIAFHNKQVIDDYTIETSKGVFCSLKSIPIRRVGIYIPGGTAPLFSTLLMLGIPAKVANSEEIIICTPYNNNSLLIPEIAYIAGRLSISKVYRVGGAQAIAAMAFGTETVPKVDKIFGPGNQYVTYAKQYISMISKTAIDMPAGPSEVLIIADREANPNFVAQDLLAQAEHGKDSMTVLLSDSPELLDEVDLIIKKETKQHPRLEILDESLQNCFGIHVKNLQEAVNLSNDFGPEHLIINTKDAEELSELVSNAGSVFIGPYAAESFGDYASGTNHTLPTAGYTNAYSGVKTSDFMKTISFQSINQKGLESLGKHVVNMAKREGLYSHAKSIEVRLEELQK